jgi:hypothetical protein
MRVQTLITRGTVTVLGIPPTFRHPSQVVLMQELAGIGLLAQTTQPMLTDGREPLTITRMGRQLFWGLEVLRGRIGVSQWAMQRT